MPCVSVSFLLVYSLLQSVDSDHLRHVTSEGKARKPDLRLPPATPVRASDHLLLDAGHHGTKAGRLQITAMPLRPRFRI